VEEEAAVVVVGIRLMISLKVLNNVGNWAGDRIGGNVGHGIGNYVTGNLGNGPVGHVINWSRRRYRSALKGGDRPDSSKSSWC
jgi:hypothetical protein